MKNTSYSDVSSEDPSSGSSKLKLRSHENESDES
jgi:hypothetical protein